MDGDGSRDYGDGSPGNDIDHGAAAGIEHGFFSSGDGVFHNNDDGEHLSRHIGPGNVSGIYDACCSTENVAF